MNSLVKWLLITTLSFLILGYFLVSEKSSALHDAIDHISGPANSDDLTKFEGLLNNSNIDQQDEKGRTPLYRAVIRRDMGLISLLLENGADVNLGASWKGYKTPLHVASGLGYFEIAGILLDFGGDVNGRTKGGQTPLHYASWFRHPQIVKLLLRKGAIINAKDKRGWTALHAEPPYEYDRLEDYRKIVELLIANGADINARAITSVTPLLTAVFVGDKEVVEMMMKHGADVNVAGNIGLTPLEWAKQNGKTELVKILRNQ